MPAVSRTMITMALLGALAAPAAPGPTTAVAAAGPEMIAPVMTAAAGQPVQQEVRVLWAVGRPGSRGTRGAIPLPTGRWCPPGRGCGWCPCRHSE